MGAGRDGWAVNREAVNLLLIIFGYPGIKPTEPPSPQNRGKRDNDDK